MYSNTVCFFFVIAFVNGSHKQIIQVTIWIYSSSYTPYICIMLYSYTHTHTHCVNVAHHLHHHIINYNQKYIFLYHFMPALRMCSMHNTTFTYARTRLVSYTWLFSPVKRPWIHIRINARGTLTGAQLALAKKYML